MKPVLPARLAREHAGFTLHQAARRLRITPERLEQLERTGFPYFTAARAAELYGCAEDNLARPDIALQLRGTAFIHTSSSGGAAEGEGRGAAAASLPRRKSQRGIKSLRIPNEPGSPAAHKRSSIDDGS